MPTFADVCGRMLTCCRSRLAWLWRTRHCLPLRAVHAFPGIHQLIINDFINQSISLSINACICRLQVYLHLQVADINLQVFIERLQRVVSVALSRVKYTATN
jgi:hypothetical protein